MKFVSNKTSKMMEVFMTLKASGKSVFYGDLLRAGFHKAHIENAILSLSEYGYEVEVSNSKEVIYTRLSVK